MRRAPAVIRVLGAPESGVPATSSRYSIWHTGRTAAVLQVCERASLAMQVASLVIIRRCTPCDARRFASGFSDAYGRSREDVLRSLRGHSSS
jgi:hypothetical protein